jgi:hypothetical protein
VARGVTCSRCGASTPLPDDVRVPTFACAFCHETLSTAAYAGSDVVSAEQMRAHFAGLMDNRGAPQAPQVQFTNTRTEPRPCVHCGVVLQVPLDMRAKTVACAACGRTEPVTRYFSDGQRMMLDAQRQISGNQALARLRAQGVPCGQCGARNPVTEEAAVQVICQYCRAPILLSDHVDTSAVARSRLRMGVDQLRAGIADRERQQKRLNVIITVAVFACIGLALVVFLVLQAAR